jgi:hypothetical protein
MNVQIHDQNAVLIALGSQALDGHCNIVDDAEASTSLRISVMEAATEVDRITASSECEPRRLDRAASHEALHIDQSLPPFTPVCGHGRYSPEKPVWE